MSLGRVTGAELAAIIALPSRLVALAPDKFNDIVRLARRQILLGRLAVEARRRPHVWQELNDKARQVLDAAMSDAEYQRRRLLWEADRARRALLDIGVTPILLKGGAYAAAQLVASRGRWASDLDILVPAHDLARVEAALGDHGWQADQQTAYDEQYYRRWMHQLPPIRHQTRKTLIDVHHTILPLTARPKPSPEALIAAAVPCGDGFLRLGNADLVIHAATHLFHDGDFTLALRNLIEINDLVVEFAGDEEFWEELLPRAQQLHLARDLSYALMSVTYLFRTNIPESVLQQAQQHLPMEPVQWLMKKMVSQVGANVRAPIGRPRFSLSQWLFWLRGHWLRMPPLMLARHLATKAVMRRRD